MNELLFAAEQVAFGLTLLELFIYAIVAVALVIIGFKLLAYLK